MNPSDPATAASALMVAIADQSELYLTIEQRVHLVDGRLYGAGRDAQVVDVTAPDWRGPPDELLPWRLRLLPWHRKHAKEAVRALCLESVRHIAIERGGTLLEPSGDPLKWWTDFGPVGDDTPNGETRVWFLQLVAPSPAGRALLDQVEAEVGRKLILEVA